MGEMFQIGQVVYHKTGKYSGTVQESDSAVTYLVQANGVEIDFPTRDLAATPPQAKEDPALVFRGLAMKDIGPEHEKVLAIIPMRTLQAVAALWEREKAKGRFSALNVAEKLNYIADVTEVPYLVMRRHTGEPGHLGLMMSRGLTGRVTGRRND